MESVSGSARHQENSFDVIVVGLGPGGEFVANKLARKGLLVLAVEKHLTGGECPFYGCMPTKIMVRAADSVHEAASAPGVATVQPDFAPVASRITAEITHGWTDHEQVKRLSESGATHLHGTGTLLDSHTVSVDGEHFEATRGIVLATGTAPSLPPVDGLSEAKPWTNREVVKVTEAPESLAVIGAGPIGCELAQVFSRFGSRVTLLEVGERIMSVEEPETSQVMATVFAREGIAVRTGVEISSVERKVDSFELRVDGEVLSFERLLVSAGREPNITGLGLEALDVVCDGNSLAVDGYLRLLDRSGSPVPGLYAVGDITGKGLFTHTATQQAHTVAAHIVGDHPAALDTRATPRVTYTSPEVGSVGLSEAAARTAGLDVKVGFHPNRDTSRGHAHGAENDGFIKLIFDDQFLVGATAVGPAGGEVLSMLTLAVHARIPKSTLTSMVYPFPTWHEGVRMALAKAK